MADLVYVAGLKELQEALRQLPKNIARNVLRGGVAAGAAVIRKEAQARAPFYYPAGSYTDLATGKTHVGKLQDGHPPPGTLKRSIVQKQINELSNETKQVFYVTVRKGKKYQKQGKKGNLSQDAYYATWVEFGTAKMAARPFMRPAFEAKKAEAIQAIKAYIEKRIPEEVAKVRGKTP
jgi:HK97 gp10 family phage protein